jgi:hypothetical protein
MKRTDIYERGLDSAAIWNNNAPTFLVGELNLAAYLVQVNLLSTRLFELAQSEDLLHTARMGRDGVATNLRAIIPNACRLIAGTAAIGDAIATKVQAVYRVRDTSFVALKQKTEKLVIAWTAVNAHRAALSPVQGPLLVGTKTVTELQSDCGNYAQLLKNISDKEDPVSTKRQQVINLAVVVDKYNKRFYKAWLGHWPAGSPQRAALSIIDTGAASPIPGPGVFTAHTILPNGNVKLAFGASRALTYTILYKGPGATEYTQLATGVDVRTYEHVNPGLGDHHYIVFGTNNQGNGSESAVLAVEITQQAAA